MVDGGPAPCLVLGAGGHCRVVLSLLLDAASRYQVCEVLDLNAENTLQDEVIMGVRVAGGIDLLQERFSNGIKAIFLAIGDNRVREQYFKTARMIGYCTPNLIASTAIVDPTVKMGEANVICHHAYIGPMASAGDNNLLNTGCIVEHESSVGNATHIGPATVVAGRCHIGNRVSMGVGVRVINSLSIADDTIIGAGSVVINNIETSGGLYVGAPARRIRDL